jgi:hypothetical protein
MWANPNRTQTWTNPPGFLLPLAAICYIFFFLLPSLSVFLTVVLSYGYYDSGEVSHDISAEVHVRRVLIFFWPNLFFFATIILWFCFFSIFFCYNLSGEMWSLVRSSARSMSSGSFSFVFYWTVFCYTRAKVKIPFCYIEAKVEIW